MKASFGNQKKVTFRKPVGSRALSIHKSRTPPPPQDFLSRSMAIFENASSGDMASLIIFSALSKTSYHQFLRKHGFQGSL